MTVAATDKFTAGPSALGYLYQCRYALLLLLDRGRLDQEAQLSIECFDDIAFEKHGSPQELIQTKHRLGKPPDVSDSSEDLWATLRVWSESVFGGIIAPPTACLTLVTTAKCSPGSAGAFLKGGSSRDPVRAQELLLAAASRMKNKALKAAREAFLALGDQKQRDLLQCVHVIDSSPDITDVEAEIRRALGFPVAGKWIGAFQTRLEGWWFGEVIKRLTGAAAGPISAVSLFLATDDLRESFRAESLPIDFRSARPPEGSDALRDRTFVQQLRLIGLGDKNINWARVDFYRAYAQRSRWLSDNLVAIQQLEAYDAVLAEEWERERDRLEDGAEDGEPASAVVSRGAALYEHLRQNCAPIRERCTEPYVGRGSYHLLADRCEVGWHRDFLELLKAEGTSGGGAKT